VFGKVESERMPVKKVWDHAIDLKEDFKASKAKVYPLSRNKRDEGRMGKSIWSWTIKG